MYLFKSVNAFMWADFGSGVLWRILDSALSMEGAVLEAFGGFWSSRQLFISEFEQSPVVTD